MTNMTTTTRNDDGDDNRDVKNGDDDKAGDGTRPIATNTTNSSSE